MRPDSERKRSGAPMDRPGEMHELVNLAAFLLGPGVDYMTGQTIAIDGGAYAGTSGNFYQMLGQWGDEEWAAAKAAIQGQNEKDRKKRTGLVFLFADAHCASTSVAAPHPPTNHPYFRLWVVGRGRRWACREKADAFS